MAQIIKHKRGNLEGLASATTRAGELLVVTGSTGLGTIANGDSLVFVGIDGSTATPVNKILQGTTVPNLTGTDYNTRVDGIPFFDTDDQKLYILNKGGNIEVKATPQTATTAYVQREVSDLLGGAPAAFDTLLEISASIANGDSDVVSLTTTVGTKLAKASNLSDLSNAGTARTNLGVGAAAGTDNSTNWRH